MTKFEIFVIAIILIVSIISDLYLRRKLAIPRRRIFWYKTVNNSHKWGERIISFTYIIGAIILIYKDLEFVFLVKLMFTYFFILFLFRTYMEWRYDSENKEYVLSIVGLVYYLLLILLFLIFSN